jgi:hypothetical protein
VVEIDESRAVAQGAARQQVLELFGGDAVSFFGHEPLVHQGGRKPISCGCRWTNDASAASCDRVGLGECTESRHVSTFRHATGMFDGSGVTQTPSHVRQTSPLCPPSRIGIFLTLLGGVLLLTKNFRALVQEMRNEEVSLLMVRTKAADNVRRRTLIAIAASTAMSLVLLPFFGWALRREASRALNRRSVDEWNGAV